MKNSREVFDTFILSFVCGVGFAFGALCLIGFAQVLLKIVESLS